MNQGFLMLRRSDEMLELTKDHKAFGLLTQIAVRARRTDGFNLYGLNAGQALIGDHASCGLSKQEYRSAKRRLEAWGFASFEATNRGTIATLLDTRIYDINQTPEQHTTNTQPTLQQHTVNTQPTPNNNDKNEKNDNKPTPDADAFRLARLFFDLIRQGKPDFRRPDLHRWARDIERMIRRDGRDPARIEAALRWCQADAFWQSTILSPAVLRKHFDRLELKMTQARPRESLAEIMADIEREDRPQ